MTNGRPWATQTRQASFCTARLPRVGELDLDPAVAQPLEAARRHLRVRVADRRDDPRHARRDDRVGARRRRAVVRARLERDVERRAARALARRRRAPRPRHAARPRPAYQPSPTTSPSRTTTAPTSGCVGSTCPRPRSASSSARSRLTPRAWTSRRYARGRSSRPKIAVAATNSVAPASRSSRDVVRPTPPSTWTGIDLGQQLAQRAHALERLRHELLARVAGVDAHAEHEVDLRLERGGAASSTLVSGLKASPTCRPCSRASATVAAGSGRPRSGR